MWQDYLIFLFSYVTLSWSCHALLILDFASRSHAFVSHILTFCVTLFSFCNTFLLLCHTFFFLHHVLLCSQRYPAQDHAFVSQVLLHHSFFLLCIILDWLSVTYYCSYVTHYYFCVTHSCFCTIHPNLYATHSHFCVTHSFKSRILTLMLPILAFTCTYVSHILITLRIITFMSHSLTVFLIIAGEPRVDCQMPTAGTKGIQLEQTDRHHQWWHTHFRCAACSSSSLPQLICVGV